MISDAVSSFSSYETEWDAPKLEKKIREYHNKAAKNLDFKSKHVVDLINEYVDNFFSSLFASLGDREWLYSGQADFIHIIDSGVKEQFPRWTLQPVPEDEFQRMVMDAHDRAFEEQRFGPILTEAVNAQVQGPKIKKKVWNAIDEGRKEAAYSGAAGVEDFVGAWIEISIAKLAESCQGDPTGALEAPDAVRIFNAIIAGGGIPLALVQDRGPPPADWPLVEQVVRAAYGGGGGGKGGGKKGGWSEGPPAKRMKGGW